MALNAIFQPLLSRVDSLLKRVAAALKLPVRSEQEKYVLWVRRVLRLTVLELRDPAPLNFVETTATAGIDVVFPVGPRDVDMLPRALEGVETNLIDHVNRVWIVAPRDICESLRRVCPSDAVIMAEEELSVIRDAMHPVRSRFEARAGWMIQQLVTLSTPEITDAEAAIVIDADTMLVRPRRFRAGDTTLLLAAHEFHIPYYETLARLWRKPAYTPLYSYVAHHMCFLSEDVRNMRTAIEALWDRAWWEAILACSDPRNGSTFSEYELYAQWRLANPDRVIVRPMRNVAIPRSAGRSLTEFARLAPRRAYSVSSHWHMN